MSVPTIEGPESEKFASSRSTSSPEAKAVNAGDAEDHILALNNKHWLVVLSSKRTCDQPVSSNCKYKVSNDFN